MGYKLKIQTVTVKRKKLILKKWIRVTILILFLITAVFSTLKLLSWKKDSNKTVKIEKEIIKNVDITEKKPVEENIEIINPPKDDKDNDYWNYIKMDMLSINLNELKKKNNDTKAWIKVNGTNINYPVVQAKDNKYYLDHSFDKKYNKAGWVFADYRNNFDDFDKNTIIYAHGRVDTTMFGSLKNILKSSWYSNKNNHVIKLSTLNSNTLWQVFSVYTIEAESYYITTKFSTSDEFREFVNTLKQRSEVNFSSVPSASDKILTLSTCKDSKGNRIVMHAKLIKIENK